MTFMVAFNWKVQSLSDPKTLHAMIPKFFHQKGFHGTSMMTSYGDSDDGINGDDDDDGVNPGGMCCTGHATGREGHAICPILSAGHQNLPRTFTTLHYITSECITFATFYLLVTRTFLVHSLHCITLECITFATDGHQQCTGSTECH